ncbi:uncharacterized protein V6R79_009297 [Siganus canaliculatus]
MLVCCISSCTNRFSSANKVKLFRIPDRRRRVAASRRRLWLQAIQQVNGSAEELERSVYVCNAHFVSGTPSRDKNDVDFVPSVFTCSKQSSSTKKKAKWFYARRKRRCQKSIATRNTRSTRSRPDSLNESANLMDETQTPSSPPEFGEPLTDESDVDSEVIPETSSAKSSPNKETSQPEVPAGIVKLDKGMPFVPLKPIFTLRSGFLCELCNQYFPDTSQLLKHRHLHEEKTLFCNICEEHFTSLADFTEHQQAHDSSFPCNICDRTFTTSQNLKRHKLLHVKDGRKCNICGVLFCRRHNHILFQPQPESEQDLTIIEESDSDSVSSNDQPPESELDQSADLQDDAPSSTTVTTEQTVLPSPPPPAPLTNNCYALPPLQGMKVMKMPLPIFIEPDLYLPEKKEVRNQYAVPQPYLPPKVKLPQSLKLFSPKFLTSALLDVNRNYDYILSKPKSVMEKKLIVKEEQEKVMLISPDEQNVQLDQKERVAYDLKIML